MSCAIWVYNLRAYFNILCACYAVSGHTGSSVHVSFNQRLHNVYHLKTIKQGTTGARCAQVRCSLRVTLGTPGYYKRMVLRKSWPLCEIVIHTMWLKYTVQRYMCNIGTDRSRLINTALNPYTVVACSNTLCTWVLTRSVLAKTVVQGLQNLSNSACICEFITFSVTIKHCMSSRVWYTVQLRLSWWLQPETLLRERVWHTCHAEHEIGENVCSARQVFPVYTPRLREHFTMVFVPSEPLFVR